jgi:membrane-associated phospholipid phosphatase
MATRLTALKNRSLFLIGFLLIIQFNALAQDDSLTGKPTPFIPVNHRSPSTVPDKDYFKSWLTDARDIVIFPYRWNKYQWIAFSGVTVVGALIYTQDAGVQKIVEKNQNPFLNNASTYGFERLGSGVYTLPAMAILYGFGAIYKDDKARSTALKGVEAYIFGFVSAQILKQLTHRHRPYQEDPPNPYLWDGPFEPISNSSFPSGHSTVAFAVATVLATAYSKTIWVPIVCYTFAALTAASRVYQNDHWISDVFIGSAVGFAIGHTIVNNHIKRLKILPVSHTGMGVMLVYQLD